jgi:hypothetical protein
MAILTAKYTSAQSNSSSLNTTPHELNSAMGLIGGNPNGRPQSVTDYVKRSPDFIATVTSSQIKASFSPTQNADFYFGIFNQNYSGSDAAYLFNGITGTITGWTSGVNGSLNDRYSVTGINIDAQTYFNRATWATILDGSDTMVGGPGSDVLQNYGSNNKFQGMGGNDTFIAAAGGINTAFFRGKSADYSIKSSSRIEYDGLIGLSGFTANDSVSNRDGFTQLINVNRLSFTDTNLALDVGPTQNAGSVYMLYKAAFNRPSDAGGMGYWISLKDSGVDIVTNIAQGFVNSAEFIAKYGANPSNSSYVNNLYQNVLGRAGEGGGVAYWTGEMDAGRVNKAQALVQFATLPEGAGIVAPLIANGIQYKEWVG